MTIQEKAEVARTRLNVMTNLVDVLAAVNAMREWEVAANDSRLPLLRLLDVFGWTPDERTTRGVCSQLFWDLVSGIEVLRGQGCALDDAKILDRAANMMAGLTGNYKITPL